ncbi:glycosyltransferase family 4 protein [Acaryochloris marina]|uniref:glycosyltransferase family 4 protein n=1 Tax=Acaryochloris marina TaxID=155978 RepID=UPI001BB0D4A0|nr:glycosyltransferase family 4 protein [Acaryochloris marina]QUY40606.1 glycosyltransferase family 4 protein [Acaryochloris marina S15]
MKVLHINQSDISGGAAIAGYRLHKELLKQGVNSKLLVGNLQTDDEEVNLSPRRYRLENQLGRFTSRLGFNHLNYFGSFDIPKHRFFQECDLLNFHNLHFAGFSYMAIPKLTKSKPAIFTLHDMWSFTGHCAYSFDCNRWQNGCGSCPYPETIPAIKRDTTRWEWKFKNWVYRNSDLVIVSPSKWLAQQAKKSILNQFSIHHIPYGIDTDIYKPLDNKLSRSILGIPLQKKVLLFCAVKLNEPRKGGDLLIKSLSSLPEKLKKECILITLGKPYSALDKSTDIETIHLGYITNDRIKAIVYSSADLFLLPTRADNLPVVLQESMACGTATVSFRVGGVQDLVRPNVTGYLAQEENIEDFSKGIEVLLKDDKLRYEMGLNCRLIALEEYSSKLQAKRYLNLYRALLNRKSNSNQLTQLSSSI